MQRRRLQGRYRATKQKSETSMIWDYESLTVAQGSRAIHWDRMEAQAKMGNIERNC